MMRCGRRMGILRPHNACTCRTTKMPSTPAAPASVSGSRPPPRPPVSRPVQSPERPCRVRSSNDRSRRSTVSVPLPNPWWSPRCTNQRQDIGQTFQAIVSSSGTRRRHSRHSHKFDVGPPMTRQSGCAALTGCRRGFPQPAVLLRRPSVRPKKRQSVITITAAVLGRVYCRRHGLARRAAAAG
jgi:hypothetical protein